MHNLNLGNSSSSSTRILCLGAHSDDIEIGCGGTLRQLAISGRQIEVRWVVFSGNEDRAIEARKSAEHWLRDVPEKVIETHGFRDGFFPDDWAKIKELFIDIKNDFEPDVVFTHFRDDLHQDHRTLNRLTWNAFRNHLVLEYEIPKFDGDQRSPNFYVPLDESIAREKVDGLMRFFGTQRSKHWFCDELFIGLMRMRGIESCSPSGYSEGFYSRKANLVF